MARTRLRGIEIAGVRIAVEAPGAWPWDWPRRLAPLRVRAVEAELYVSVRLGRSDLRPEESTVYAFARGTFEVGRLGREWLAVVRDDLGTRVARFDRALRTAEVVVEPRGADVLAVRHPLEHPLDELLVLHRVAREGGLLVRGALQAGGRRAILRLGAGEEEPGVGAPGEPCEGRVVLRTTASGVRAWDTPWSGGAASRPVRLDAVHVLRSGVGAGARRLDRDGALGELLAHLVAPIHCPDMAHAGARAAERVAAALPVLQVSVPEPPARVVPFAWDRREAALAFAPPPPPR